MKIRLLLLVLLCVAAIPPDPKESFRQYVDRYLADYYRWNPSVASIDGVHDYDSQLECFSAECIQGELEALNGFELEVFRIPMRELPAAEQQDYRVLFNNIRARHLELEQIQSWKSDPQVYGDAVSNALMFLALYEFDTPEARLRQVIAREKQIPQVFRQARQNLSDAPPVFVKVGADSIEGLLSFVESDIPKAFESVSDEALLAEFRESTATAADSIRAFVKFLEEDLRPRARGSYALGDARFRELLRDSEQIEASPDELMAMIREELRKTQQKFRETAAGIDPARDPRDVWKDMQRNHPPAGHLVEEAQKQLDRLIEFIRERKIVTLPDAPPVWVADSPAFMRSGFASMWNPGPFETKPLRSPYFITDVDPDWTDEQKEEHLSAFNIPQLWTTSIHEAYPGHYVQGLYARMATSKVRKAWPFASTAFTEGWAHYCEQMMIDEGFGGGDPALRMGQLADALLRLARAYVGISMHTRGMTVDQGTEFFMKNAFMEQFPSEMESERGTYDPLYVTYAIGKLDILKLREDYRKKMGDKFTLQDFHDRLLASGNVPVPVHRKLLLGAD